MIRLASGEHFRKVTDAERRWLATCFLFVPLFLGLFDYILLSFADHADAAANWSFVAIVLVSVALAVTQWPKYFSARASLLLGVFVWGITLWVALA
jgi:hypothetical protein